MFLITTKLVIQDLLGRNLYKYQDYSLKLFFCFIMNMITTTIPKALPDAHRAGEVVGRSFHAPEIAIDSQCHLEQY